MRTVHRSLRRALPLAAVAAVAVVAGCASRPGVGLEGDGDALGGSGRGAGATRLVAPPELSAVYRRMGLIGGQGDLPFVGRAAFFATPAADSTHVLLVLSLPNRALTFVREGDRYRAPYEVRLDVRRGAAPVRQVAADEVVRVGTFRETARTDESVLFYQRLVLAPGSYSLSAAMRDVESGRSTAVEVPLVVPRLGPGALSTPLVAYDVAPRTRLDSAPRVAASARASVVFGQDSVVAVYVEAYAPAGAAATRLPVRAVVRGDRGVHAWSDTTSLPRAAGAGVAAGAAGAPTLYAGVVRLPVARLGIGVLAVTVVAADAGVADSARAPLFVSLGEDLPITGLDELLAYLRWYAAPERLRALRDTAPEARAGAWAEFLRASDPVSTTVEHEGLRDYFARVRAANVRFTEEGGAGWQTDRGMTYVALGEPDQIFDPGGPDVNVRGRQQIWDYRNPRLQLVFVDQSGFGRWRLTPGSAAEVQAAIARRLVR